MAAQQKVNIFDLITVLEMPKSSLDFLKWNYETSLFGLKEFKEKVNSQRRLLAKKYHPDLADGNGELMKKINAVTDLLLKVEIKKPQPQPSIIIQFGWGIYGTNTGTSTTSV